MTHRRVLTGAILAALLSASLLFQWLQWLLPTLFLAFGVLCLIEIRDLIQLKSLRFPFVLSLMFVVLFLSDGYLADLRHGFAIVAIMVVVLLTERVLRQDYRNLAAEVGAGLLATLYIGLPVGMAAAIARMPEGSGGALGEWLLVYQLAVVFCGDTAAYFVGRRWGRRPFFQRLSPKKTLEGAAASVSCSIAVALLLVLIAPQLRWFLGLGHGLMLGAILGLVGPLGDLAESAFKRDAGRKDSGLDFTGHGGFLDLLDAVLFGLPIQFCYIKFFLSP
ncbi:phosphatidate cytidylyltransferase [Candidatus Sumerlaeota bacterium]|nr:phosphatidate cytidylyltransferase [Candidatus Sumerlaeota bacterium]